MKRIIYIFGLLLVALSLQRCADAVQEESGVPQPVQFSFDALAPEGGRVATALPAATHLRLTIENSAGESVYVYHRVELLSMGSGLITEPIMLAPGSYQIKDFLLMDGHNEVRFATPRKGSPMSRLVRKPLSWSLAIARGKTNVMSMDVVSTVGSTPEDFGYASFDILPVYPIRLEVVANNKLTTAQGYILHGTDTIKQFTLGARENIVGFTGDVQGTYQLVLVKSGYAVQRQEFIYDQLMSTLNGKAWRLALTPAFTFTARQDAVYGYFDTYLSGTSGAHLTIDWGDGTSEAVTLTGVMESYQHTYPIDGLYYVSITGDLSSITEVKSVYGDGVFTEINTDQLVNLVDLRIALTDSPSLLDLRKNKKLEYVLLAGASDLATLQLPTTHRIQFIDISGPSKITTASVNAAIKNIYNNATQQGIYQGGFDFARTWFPETNVMIRKPSAESLAMLRTLRDNYGWTVHPNP